MADKNFVVKNGLEVNTNLIFADKNTNKVGIGTTVASNTLQVNGGIGATSLNVTGFSTVGNITINGRVTAGSSLGASGQYLVSTGAGITWASIPKLRDITTQTAGVGATSFNINYTVGLVDVYINGVKLSGDEYTADNGATIVLDDPCFGGETVEFILYTSTIGIGGSAIQGITVLEEGSPVGGPLQVTSINFVGASVTAVGSGLGVTVYLADYITSSGIATYSSKAGIATYSSIAGIATYSSSAGISTYADTSGISTYAITAGVSTDVIGGIASVTSVTAGIVTATDGFISIANTTPITIELVGNQLTFNAIGIGSTTFTLF